MLSGSAGEDVPSGPSYEELYLEHAPAARRLARSLVPRDVADHIVAEAFTRVLGAIRAGGGPGIAFRGYLFTAVRNLASDWLRGTRRVAAVGDLEAGNWTAERSGAISHLSSGAEVQAEARAEARLVARAFARLPVRWRAVLWQLEVEGRAPAAVAPLFGLSANGVSALAVRAREGLRQAYLQEHIGANIPVPCRAYTEALGAGARGRLSRRRRAAVHEHLRQCPACSDLFTELSELNGRLGAILAPAVLAGGSAAIASAASAAASVATAVGRHAVLLRARLSGPARLWRLWRLHPATGVASVAAGVAAAGGMVVAVSISPANVSPSHAAPRPITSITVPGNSAGGGAHGGSPSLGTAGSLARVAQRGVAAVAGCAAAGAQAAAGRGGAGGSGGGSGSGAVGGTGSAVLGGVGSSAASVGTCAAAGGAGTVSALPGGIVAVQAPAGGGNTASPPAGPVRQVTQGVRKALASTAGNLGQTVANAAQALGGVLGDTASGLGNAVGGATGNLGGVVGGTTRNLEGVVGSTTNGLGGLVRRGTSALGGAGRHHN